MLRALRKKRPHMSENIENVLLHQDNVPCHSSKHTQAELDILGIDRIEHAPYSPDLAPMDFALFPTAKAELRRIHFDNFDWFRNVFHAWVRRHEKCIEAEGRYFEKE